ncbi:hypothetical protein D3C87_1409660 [compost metagenome]
MNDLIIEAQKIPGSERHAFIFQSFDNLEGGESLVIVNTHDPVPLLNQFQERRTDAFTYAYLESGPTRWRVRLTKNNKEGCCGFCGGE